MADVFVGFLFDMEKEAELLATSKRGVSTAPNQYQKGFLSGFGKEMQILTTISTGSFPKLNTRLVFRMERKNTPEGEILYLPFLNFYILRDWMFEKGLYRELEQIIEKQDHTTVYVYSLNLPFLKPMRKLKKKFGEKVHYCLIVPDLAGKYGLIRRGIKGIKDIAEAQKKMQMANDADSFVFLTEAMKDLFDAKPYTVIEGFLPDCEFDYSLKRNPKTVLYTGSLNRAYGFGTLLEAFSKITDPDARLWICGAGDMEGAVKEAARQDPRIEFKGFLPKREIATLQTQCDVLINPRTDEGEYTKYSFPSKTMEYLLSGSKVVMYRLPGIGEEYYRFIRTIDAPGAEAMAKALHEAWADTEFYEARSQAQIIWMRENKDSKAMVNNAIFCRGRQSKQI